MHCTAMSVGERNFPLHYNFMGPLLFVQSTIYRNAIMQQMAMFYLLSFT